MKKARFLINLLLKSCICRFFFVPLPRKSKMSVYMIETINIERFSAVDLSDAFFDSLKKDYPGFEAWFKKKGENNEVAYVQRDENNQVQAFLYLKIEEEAIEDVTPIMPAKRRLKIGTFKVNGHNTRVGERFFKKAFDYAIANIVEEIYVTIFDRTMQKPLIEKIKTFGFEEWGRKGEELVFVKSLRADWMDIEKDYPLIHRQGRKKYVLGIKPKFHSCLFPDSSVMGERYDVMADISHMNSIHKVYICFMPDTRLLKRGDVLVVYRTSDVPGQAWYRSVATSVCVVEDVKTRKDFANVEEFLRYAKGYSVFSEADLRRYFRNPSFLIIKMTYNIALVRRLNRKRLVEEIHIPENVYWGFFEISDTQFDNIVRLGECNENYFIN